MQTTLSRTTEMAHEDDSCQFVAQTLRLEVLVRESISVSLPEKLKAELDQLTALEGISRSDVVREALREYLFSRRFRALRQELMPYAEAQGIYHLHG